MAGPSLVSVSGRSQLSATVWRCKPGEIAHGRPGARPGMAWPGVTPGAAQAKSAWRHSGRPQPQKAGRTPGSHQQSCTVDELVCAGLPFLPLRINSQHLVGDAAHKEVPLIASPPSVTLTMSTCLLCCIPVLVTVRCCPNPPVLSACRYHPATACATCGPSLGAAAAASCDGRPARRGPQHNARNLGFPPSSCPIYSWLVVPPTRPSWWS